MRSRSRRQRVRHVQLAGHELEPFNIHHHLALYTAQGLQAQAKFKATLPPEKKRESAACKGLGKIQKD